MTHLPEYCCRFILFFKLFHIFKYLYISLVFMLFDCSVRTSAADSAHAYTTLIPTGHETTLTFTRTGALQYFSFLPLLSPNITHQLSSWATRGS